MGIKIKKIHRTISFDEEAWLKKYIDNNTENRKRATCDFEKDIWKLLNNSFYGKTVENQRNRMSVKFSNEEKETKRLISKTNFTSCKIFNDYVLIRRKNKTVYLNKPIYLGACILDLSKLLMYEFYYNIINKQWPLNELIYSDSVTEDTPIILRKDGKVFIEKISNITENYCEYENSKFRSQINNNLEVLTSKGFKQLKLVIKHQTNKKIYRITTSQGIVDVTEDHSLLDENHMEIKPEDLTLNTALLNYQLFENKSFNIKKELNEILNTFPETIDDKRAFIEGFFLGDGSSGFYNYTSGIKYTWYLCNQDLEILNKLMKYCKEVYRQDFKIIDVMKSSQVYRIIPIGNIKSLALEYENFYTNRKEKYIPSYVMNNNYTYRKFFFYGFYHADGCKSNFISYSQKSKITNSCLSFLIQSLGYSINLNSRKDKPNIFNNLINDKQITNKVKKIELISENKINTVYDLSTETGDFNCGFPLIVKNTDSFIVNINTYDIYEDMKSIEHLFDFSDYPKDHFLFSDKNKKVIGIPKDELNGKLIREIIALKSKLYFIDVFEDKIIKKLKGITKATIKHQVTFDNAKNCLENEENQSHNNYNIRAQNFEINTVRQNKISMSPFDNKRYLINNIETIPYCTDETKNYILKEKLINNMLDEMINLIQ